MYKPLIKNIIGKKLKVHNMKIRIQSVAFVLRKDLNDFVKGKVKKLKHLYSEILGIEVSLKINKSATLENKVCMIRLVIPGYDMLAHARCHTFEEATAVAIEALERQIEKRKSKLIANRVVENKLMFSV